MNYTMRSFPFTQLHGFHSRSASEPFDNGFSVCYPTRMTKTILYAQPCDDQNCHYRYDGIRRSAALHGWNAEIIPYDTDKVQWAGLIAFWNAAGLIVDCGNTNRYPRRTAFGETPVVFVDRDPRTLRPDDASVNSDSIAIAEAAVRELTRQRCAAYAFADPPTDFYWSLERLARFRACFALNGIRTRRFRAVTWPTRNPDDMHALAKRLSRLPRPLGVFTACDTVAASVLEAAALLGWRCPGDIFVISTDNDINVCTRARTPITSIEMNFEGSGFLAGELLNDLLSGSRPDQDRLHRTFGINGIVRRASCETVHSRDSRITLGTNYILAHAHETLAVADVADAMGCSLRTAQALFRKELGQSIVACIRRQRLELMRQVTRHNTSLSSDALAKAVGYANRSSLWKLKNS